MVAAVEPLAQGESTSTSSRQSKIAKAPWQDRCRKYYHEEDTAIDLCVEYVDLRSSLAGLYPARAKVRDMGNTYVNADDPILQALADEWRDADTGFQAVLVRDAVRETSLVGEFLHQEMVKDGTLRFRVVGTDQLQPRETYQDQDGKVWVLLQLRSDAGPRPRNGEDRPGYWEWAEMDRLSRCWQRGRMSHDATSQVRKGLRYLDRMAELEQKFFRANDSHLMVNKVLALETNPDLKEGDVDKVVANYYAAAEMTRHDHGSVMGQVPLIMRLRSPEKATLLDLGGDVSPEDIATYELMRELFASTMDCPKQALLEGAGASQRNLNNWLLDEGLHQQCIQTAVDQVFRDATKAYLRPTMARFQERGLLTGYVLDDVVIGWDPLASTLADASPETIMRAYQLGLLSYQEATQYLGVSGWGEDERPGVTDYEHWMVTRNPGTHGRAIGPGDLLQGWEEPSAPLELGPATEPATEMVAATRSLISGW